MNPDDRRWWEKRRYLVTPEATATEIEEAVREDRQRGVAYDLRDWGRDLEGAPIGVDLGGRWYAERPGEKGAR